MEDNYKLADNYLLLNNLASLKTTPNVISINSDINDLSNPMQVISSMERWYQLSTRYSCIVEIHIKTNSLELINCLDILIRGLDKIHVILEGSDI